MKLEFINRTYKVEGASGARALIRTCLPLVSEHKRAENFNSFYAALIDGLIGAAKGAELGFCLIDIKASPEEGECGDIVIVREMQIRAGGKIKKAKAARDVFDPDWLLLKK
jgi:hypothetical protein